MALTVPDQQIFHIKWLLGLPDQKLHGFLSVLSEAEPQFNVHELAAQISKSLQLPEPEIIGALRVLASLYLTRDFREPVEDFVDREVFFALKKVNAFAPESVEEQWRKLRRFVIAALGFERTLGTAAKAGDVLTQHERVFQSARIMTDIRPIFHVNVSEKPDAGVIIHMMKLTQRGRAGNHQDLYFALDHNDVVAMKDIIERALQKEQTLRDAMKHSGMSILDPKAHF